MSLTLTATDYIQPLREGGSLPAIFRAEDQHLYVMKFSGAGQGPKVLIAEFICGEIARALDLPMPELAFLKLDPVIGRSERDAEIQDLLKASAGLNLGMRFIPDCVAYSPLDPVQPNTLLASKIVWFDAFVSNVDRTIRNVNMLVSSVDQKLWLIDNGAALYFHHGPWENSGDLATKPFPMISHHVLLPLAGELNAADQWAKKTLTPEVFRAITAQIPDVWLEADPKGKSAGHQKRAYQLYFEERLEKSVHFVEEAQNARSKL